MDTKHSKMVMAMSLSSKIHDAIEEIKTTDIDGCITGSCMLDMDFDSWMSVPDIDIFVYSDTSMVYALCKLEAMGFVPGGKDKKAAGEELKRSWLIEDGVKSNAALSTIMYQRDGVNVNVSLKKNCNSVIEVLASFDMTIIMKGYEISTGVMLDLTDTGEHGDSMIADPNRLKRQLYNHPSRFKVDRALRQWERVLKYWDRGFDTRPMARFYLDLIDQVLAAGAQFQTERDIASFNEMEPGFIKQRETIAKWLEEHKED